MIPDYPIKRLWQRNEPLQRVGFTSEEWDEVVKAVSEKRREMLTRLNRV
jgi:hypothetical protein